MKLTWKKIKEDILASSESTPNSGESTPLSTIATPTSTAATNNATPILQLLLVLLALPFNEPVL